MYALWTRSCFVESTQRIGEQVCLVDDRSQEVKWDALEDGCLKVAQRSRTFSLGQGGPPQVDLCPCFVRRR